MSGGWWWWVLFPRLHECWQCHNQNCNVEKDINRIIEMAWEDRTPFEAIEFQFGLKEKEVIEFMRRNSLPSSFKMWRKRMKSRKTL